MSRYTRDLDWRTPSADHQRTIRALDTLAWAPRPAVINAKPIVLGVALSAALWVPILFFWVGTPS
jgi:hypothetical protein